MIAPENEHSIEAPVADALLDVLEHTLYPQIPSLIVLACAASGYKIAGDDRAHVDRVVQTAREYLERAAAVASMTPDQFVIWYSRQPGVDPERIGEYIAADRYTNQWALTRRRTMHQRYRDDARAALRTITDETE